MTSASSDRPYPVTARVGAGRLRIPGALLLLVALLPGRAPAQPAEVHREGEYGLWVRQVNEVVEVHWFTRTTTAGLLEVWRSDDLVHRSETPTSFLHSASFPAPEGGELLLRYGAKAGSDDRHETPIRLPLDRPRGPVELPAVDSLYVMGDVHGAFDRLFRVLRSAGLVDGEERWTGGSAHLVLLGDLFDRGPDVTRILWFLYGLEAEAKESGGGVHVVLGNHEIMVMTRDLRYVSPKERSLARLRSRSYTRLFDVRSSVLGSWLASRPALLRIGPFLLTHGGLSPRYADLSVREMDDTLAAYVAGDLFHRWSDTTVQVAPMDSAAVARRIDFFFGEESVFWYRGYVQGAVGLGGTGGDSPSDAASGGRAHGHGPSSASDSLARVLASVLRRHDSRVHVVAHTPLPHVRQGLRGRLIGVDLRRPASEMLLLRREGEGYGRYRLDESGTVVPLEPGGASHP